MDYFDANLEEYYTNLDNFLDNIVKSKNIDNINYIISHFDPHIQETCQEKIEFFTPMIRSILVKKLVRNNDLETIKTLGDLGIFNPIQDFEDDIIEECGEFGRLEILQYLMTIGFSPKSCLWQAISCDWCDIVEYCYDFIKDDKKIMKKCFNYACSAKLPNILNFFLERGVFYRSGIINAVVNGDFEKVVLLTSFGMDFVTKSGESPLSYSIKCYHRKIFYYLLDICDCTNLNYLSMIFELNFKINKKHLIKLIKKCDPNLPDNDGNTAFFYLTFYENRSCFKYLIDYFDINVINNKGDNALQFFLKNYENDPLRMPKIFDILKDSFDLNYKNFAGKTALDIATYRDIKCARDKLISKNE